MLSKTTFEYDYLARPTVKEQYSPKNKLLKRWSRVYKGLRLLEETDPAGVKTIYTYDGAGRQTCMKKIAPETEDLIQRIDYLYDNLGRQSEIREFFGEGENDYIAKVQTFDYLDQVTSETVTDPTGTIFSQIYYEYDEAGNRTVVKQKNQAGERVTTTHYDHLKHAFLVEDAHKKQTHTVHHYHLKHPCSEMTDPRWPFDGR